MEKQKQKYTTPRTKILDGKQIYREKKRKAFSISDELKINYDSLPFGVFYTVVQQDSEYLEELLPFTYKRYLSRNKVKIRKNIDK